MLVRSLQSHPRSRGERVTQERRDQKGTEVNEERLNRESGDDGDRPDKETASGRSFHRHPPRSSVVRFLSLGSLPPALAVRFHLTTAPRGMSEKDER